MDFGSGGDIHFSSEFLPLRRQVVDFSPVNFLSRDCDSFSDSRTGVTPGKLPVIHYLQNTETFRVPFDSEELESHPFNFNTCNAASRSSVLIDDSAVPSAHSIVYFDSTSQEFVFIGRQAPALGTYQVKETAVVRDATHFIQSSFEFDLAVVSELPSPDASTSSESEESLCLQEEVGIVGLKTTYSFHCTSGQLCL
jgi:hypothetical protein